MKFEEIKLTGHARVFWFQVYSERVCDLICVWFFLRNQVQPCWESVISEQDSVAGEAAQMAAAVEMKHFARWSELGSLISQN